MKKLKLWGVLLFSIGTILLLPNKVLAESNFDSLLTDGKLVVKSVKPTSQEMAYVVINEYTLMDKYPDYYINFENPCNEDFTKCKVYYRSQQDNDPFQEIEISYVYDEDIKTVVDSLINKLDNQDTFNLNDIEFINYLINASESSSMANYSNELKKAIDYKNFSIDVRAGDDDTFYTSGIGNAIFIYNETIYYMRPHTTAEAKHIIYVDSNTTDVLEAIKTRLNKIFGTDFNVKETGTVATFLAENSYYNDLSEYSFVADANIYEKYYTLTINNEEVSFVVIKDSSKINDNIGIITNDVASDITISTSSSTIPLDTLISVAKLTNGEEYEKIVKILNITNLDMFDLKLFSESSGDYITKLDNGSFEVKLPIKEELKDKNLVVYYVTSEGEIKEHTVTVKDGYAIFTTDHFSIYTLAEKTSSTIESTTNNPQTSDNINMYVGILFISTLGIASSAFAYLKRKNK